MGLGLLYRQHAIVAGPRQHPLNLRNWFLVKRKIVDFVEVRDVWDERWEVREARETRHGFDLLFGLPVGRFGSGSGGLSHLIATPELAQYWEATKLHIDGAIYDLPAGRTTLKRVRHRLGFNLPKDRRGFWRRKKSELKKTSIREFASKYNLDPAVVKDWRHILFGPVARPLDWWKTPESVELLLSQEPLRIVGEKLGISISHAKRLRDRAKLESAPAAEDTRQSALPPREE